MKLKIECTVEKVGLHSQIRERGSSKRYIAYSRIIRCEIPPTEELPKRCTVRLYSQNGGKVILPEEMNELAFRRLNPRIPIADKFSLSEIIGEAEFEYTNPELMFPGYIQKLTKANKNPAAPTKKPVAPKRAPATSACAARNSAQTKKKVLTLKKKPVVISRSTRRRNKAVR